MKTQPKWFTITLALALTSLSASADDVKGRILDAANNEAVPYATVVAIGKDGKKHAAVSDLDGYFTIAGVATGSYKVSVSYMGYHTLTQTCITGSNATLRIKADNHVLNEVVVTARESQGITTSSVIDRKAIEHLQPSSFTDLLALLPGGSTQLPDLTNANTIRLRQAGTGSSNYDVSAMGTTFITDGIPMNSNANMQVVKQASSSSTGDPDAGRNHTTSGVDMRTIPTDNIESVEVIRGIAPVEYGDLTSGVVIIKRKLKATPFEARFKADSYSKLLYAGKGMELGNTVMNLGMDYLDAKADPRNPVNNYKRLTLSARLQSTWKGDGWQLRWRSNTDYTGSFDNEKYDPEILKQKDDSYRSSYNRFSMSHSLLLTPTKKSGFWKSLNLDAAVAYEHSRIDQQKSINLSRDVAVSTTLEQGEHDGIYLPYHYMANVVVDGKPLNLYAKLKGLFGATTGSLVQNINAGVEWKMDKNYGHGQQYDPAAPISPGTPYRPRVYNDIPAEHQLSFYAQDNLHLPIGGNTLTAQVGLRGSSLAHLSEQYAMRGKVYLDPRINVQWQFPSINVNGKAFVIDLNAGWGRQTKFPTLLQLYPDKVYTDLVELNYYNMNADLRRLYLMTYVNDPTNYQLAPARNDKWEVRLGTAYNGNTFSVTYFHEQLKDGFRSSATILPYTYRDFDEKAIDGSTLTSRPDVNTLPYVEKTILGGYSSTTNGSQLVKEGVEWQFASQRIDAIKTRFTINGAWFKTTYTNSQPMFQTNTSAVIDGTPVNDLYVGYYSNKTGTVRQQFNTNFMADTYLPRLGLAFSLTAECMWFNSSKAIRTDGVPLAYKDNKGEVHPYTEESKNDKYLQWLINNYNESAWLTQRVPFYMFLNLKVTKDFGRWMKLALFINRMVDYMPDYTSNSGLTIRRTSKPYFGMEINFNF